MSRGSTRPRALVLRALGLGDLLAGVPALRAVRAALPGHELCLAAPAVLAPLVDLIGAVDRLLPTGELEPISWAGPPPDVAVDLHGNGPPTKRLLQALRPGRLVAFGGPGADGTTVRGPSWDPEEQERARWIRLVAWGLGADGDPDDVLLPRPHAGPVAPHGAVLVHPGAASGSRRWPVDRFATVAGRLAADGHRVLVTGSAGERALAEHVARSAALPAGSVLAGRTDVLQLAGLVSDASLVVAGDTGVAHLASAYATPSVLLFGPTPPWRWGPPAAGPHTVLWHGGPGGHVGDPHTTAVDPVLARISLEEVLDAAAQRLGPARQLGEVAGGSPRLFISS